MFRSKVTLTLKLAVLVICLYGLCILSVAGKGPSETEPNDTRETCTNVTGTSTILGHLDNKDREDWFKVPANIGPEARFTLEQAKGQVFALYVYQGTTLLASTSGKKTTETVTCKFSGSIHLKVFRDNGTGNYNIKIVRVQPTKPQAQHRPRA